jgi:putative (di)nucleoside polyphosphate hydrolase
LPSKSPPIAALPLPLPLSPLAGDTPNRDLLPYRPCVGIMLLNVKGQVWVGRRRPKWLDDVQATAWHLPKDGMWQMPQGGVGPLEPPEQAAVRELEEETAVRGAQIIGEIPEWLTYDLPDDLVGIALKGRYRGHRQRWFAMRFLGGDNEIDIAGRNGSKAEFSAWRWCDMADVPRLIVPFKRDVYAQVVTAFAHLAHS